MRILGIETATTVCAAAVVENGWVLAECSVDLPHLHSERLLPLIDESLRKVQTSLSSIDAIGISIGPGSFTGLRIGLSVAKGLAFAGGKPLVAVPTLAALAREAVRNGMAAGGGVICPMIDARRDELFTAVYRWDGTQLQDLSPSSAVVVTDVGRLIEPYHHVTLMGDGIGKFQQFLESGARPFPDVVIPSAQQRQCSAGAVALLAEELAKSGAFADLAALEPLYVKEFYTTMKLPSSQETI